MLEVERRDSANALFRSESIATQFFRRLNRSCGASYLRDLIGSFFFSQVGEITSFFSQRMSIFFFLRFLLLLKKYLGGDFC